MARNKTQGLEESSSSVVVVQDVLRRAACPTAPSVRRSNNGADSAHAGPDEERFEGVVDDDGDGPESSSAEDRLSEALFELANAPEIAYRVEPYRGSDGGCRRRSSSFPSKGHERKRPRRTVPDGSRRHEEIDDQDADNDGEDAASSSRPPRLLRIRQDPSACGRHTGGIVWETCYLLLEYMRHAGPWSLGRCLEVGAGCGLLGQVLWYRGQCQSMVLTETDPVLDNLRANVRRNQQPDDKQSDEASGLRCCRLDWLEAAEVEKEEVPRRTLEQEPLQGPFDTIVGTDVVFAPHLVDPLLRAMRKLSHDGTVAYLCVQVRCAASHRLLLERAPFHGWTTVDLTHRIPNTPGCAWGADLECHLLQLNSKGCG